MWYQPSRRLCVGVLAALLALGMGWSTVGAGMLPAKMVLSLGADGTQPGCCDHRSDAGAAGTGACMLVCLAGAQAVLPAEFATTVGGSGEIGADTQVSVSARTVHPDPDPPQRFLLD
jgi:hypothetical protein